DEATGPAHAYGGRLGAGSPSTYCGGRPRSAHGGGPRRAPGRHQRQLLLALQGAVRPLAAALARWEQRTTTEAITGLSAGSDARHRLCLILDASSQSPRSRSLYAALAEAAGDPIVGRVLSRVASARIGYLEVCYCELGFAQPLAKAKAVFAYASYRGLLQLAH